MTWPRRTIRHPVAWLRAHPRGADGLLAALVAVIGLAAHLGARRFHADDPDTIADPSFLGVVLVLCSCVPIAWRRRSPVAVLCVVTTAQCALEVQSAAGPGWLGVLIAGYSLGAHHSGRRMWWVAATFLAAVGVFVIGAATLGEAPWAAAASTLVIIPAVVVFGDSMRLRRKRLADLAERAERAERERELLARQHVQEERTRIARELHDVVAHSVSVMVIQAGAARRQLESNPGRAHVALETIESTGRAAMNEMRRILGVLRDDGTGIARAASAASAASAVTSATTAPGVAAAGTPGAATSGSGGPLGPAPSLALLSELVQVDPDLTVQLLTEGDLGDVPSGVEVNVYRVVQEALTNVRRHAGRVDTVAVRVTRRDDRLDVEVVDDGRGASTLTHWRASGVDGAGHGIIGMRERVASTGGELTVGPRPGGGWRVHAVFPIGAAQSHLAELPAALAT